MKITPPSAELACEQIRAEISDGPNLGPLNIASLAKSQKDAQTMVKTLSETWFGIPESTECWSLPSFDVLCDLCSEYNDYCGEE